MKKKKERKGVETGGGGNILLDSGFKGEYLSGGCQTHSHEK